MSDSIKNQKTVGQISQELKESSSGSVSPIDIARAQEKEYLDNLVWSAQHAMKKVDCSKIEGHDQCASREAIEGDFFIEVLLKKEKHLENVLRNYFVPRKTCPLPFYDQTVYRYSSEKEEIDYIWTVPDRETCLIFKENVNKIVPEEQSLLKMVLMLYDGTLTKMAKKLNGETIKPGVALQI